MTDSVVPLRKSFKGYKIKQGDGITLILIVDDDKINLFVLNLMLAKAFTDIKVI